MMLGTTAGNFAALRFGDAQTTKWGIIKDTEYPVKGTDWPAPGTYLASILTEISQNPKGRTDQPLRLETQMDEYHLDPDSRFRIEKKYGGQEVPSDANNTMSFREFAKWVEANNVWKRWRDKKGIQFQ